ncbi:Spy/CpxP family protein refolding chaperone [Polyangium aurulentum]|uniref:Spy/CpxP family protein refolding chaperone n=1 Tax=Polyangium aurulentum TaxID=2567896 RepID=UPI0010AE050A|nr:Spy/CpxP family protein refolding chaperone [Polyangium aurulentum]UQA59394.1 Spy/CpxP family protein refolding chaperone [Polyangium aurulentum]
MHPAFAWFGGRGHGFGHGVWFGGPRAWGGGGCGPRGGGGGGEEAGGGGGEFEGGSFGVRRPLRFLAHKLELNETQVAELATILDDLKIERAQAAVDHRRSTSAFADAVAGAKLDEARFDEIRADRVKSAERLQTAVARALGRIHGLLDDEQRKKLAYLLRTGALAI